jgi:hypothetical protein
MKPLLVALTVSYLVTWLFGIFNARQTSMDKSKARMLHFGCSLATCTLLTCLAWIST